MTRLMALWGACLLLLLGCRKVEYIELDRGSFHFSAEGGTQVTGINPSPDDGEYKAWGLLGIYDTSIERMGSYRVDTLPDGALSIRYRWVTCVLASDKRRLTVTAEANRGGKERYLQMIFKQPPGSAYPTKGRSNSIDIYQEPRKP